LRPTAPAAVPGSLRTVRQRVIRRG
jgi:hypothetical protein